MANLKDLIEKHKDEILQLHRYGEKKSSITQILIKTHKLDIGINQVDSFRRAISSCIKNFREDSEKMDKEIDEFISNFNHEPISYKSLVEPELNTLELKNSEEEEDEEVDYSNSLKSAYEHREKFWFVSEADAYYFNFPGYPAGMRFTGTFIRELKNMYSTLGRTGGLTINEICRAISLPRVLIIKIKTYLGWTHDSDPFTSEEMLSGDIDDMVDTTLEDRKLVWFQKYTRKEQRLITDAANKWWQFKGRTIDPFIEKLMEVNSAYQALPVVKFEALAGTPHALVIGPFDLHYGKYAWDGDTGSTYNRQIASDSLLNCTHEIISEIKDKNITKVFIPVGSDFFHVDTIGGTTTRGTPQDLDGQLIQIMVEGNALMIKFVDMLRQVADVELILAAGNHDYVLSHQLLEVLAAYYRNCDDVTVKRVYHFRQYTTFGNTLLGFTHGDESKLTDLPLLMATEAKEEWGGAVHKAFFTGHLHHEMSKDLNGVKVYQMPSLSGTDRWHHKKGYVGSVKGLAAYLVHETKGVRHTILENI